MAHELTFEQIQNCKRKFDENKPNSPNEKDDSGIPSASLLKALTDLGFNINQKELNAIIVELNLDTNSEEIDFPTFLRIAGAKYKQQEFNLSLEDAFKCFDEDSKGTLKYDQLKTILTDYGPKLTSEEADELLKEFVEKGKTFDFKEFISKNF